MKALIVLKDFENYKKNDIFMMDKSEKKLELYRQPRPDKLMLKDVPVEYDKETWDLVHTEAQPEKWTKAGEEDQMSQPTRTFWENETEKVYEEPTDLTGWTQGSEEDPTWTYVPAVEESREFVLNQNKVDAKEAEAQAAQKEAERKAKADLGRRSRQLSDEILDYIAGHNMQLNITAEDIDALQQTFGTIEALLRANRPFSARPLIEAIDSNANDFVTTQMQEDIEKIYQDSGLVQEQE